jgi:hypothetical protein
MAPTAGEQVTQILAMFERRGPRDPLDLIGHRQFLVRNGTSIARSFAG